MWASDADSQYDNGTNGTSAGQGIHPFALVQTKTVGEYFGLYFRNTNA